MKMDISFGGGKKVKATFNGYTVETDQPTVDGGTGSAPSPFDLFLSSLGTCIGYYVLSFCQNVSVSTEGITLHVDIQRDTQTHMVKTIQVTIQVPPTFPEKYTKAVIKAAGACAVTRHLENPPDITIALQKA